MKVGVFRNTDGGCDFYRAVNPMMTAAKNKVLAYEEIWAANLLYEAGMRTQKFWETMTSDVYLIQRLAGERLINKIREFVVGSNLKARIVVDHDDDIFNVSPMSNHYVDYGTKEIKIVHNQKIIHEWKDGVNIDIKKNQERMDEVKKTVEKADLITVTTDRLANVFKVYNPNIRVLPNCVDLSQWNRLDIRRKNQDEIRIAWAGGHSHWEDLFMIREPLRDIAAKYPNVKILMVGYMPVSMQKDYRPGQIEFCPWVETPAHPYRLAALDIDIAVIPLAQNEFNSSKSTIKWVEFSSLEIPSVTSYVAPYDTIQDTDDVDKGVFVDKNDPQAWFEGIELLIRNEELRKKYGRIAREFVKQNYDINTQYRQWISAYEEVLSGHPVQSNAS